MRAVSQNLISKFNRNKLKLSDNASAIMAIMVKLSRKSDSDYRKFLVFKKMARRRARITILRRN